MKRKAPSIVSEKPTTKRESPKGPYWASPALVVSTLALAVSVLSAYQTRLLARDTAKTSVIRQAYSVFHDMIQMQVEHAECTHVFALPALYPAISTQVRTAAATRSPDELARLALKERALALMILTRFEEALYEWRQATDADDNARAAFLKETLNHFTRRQLRNPRLLWYWADTGGNLRVYFEADAQNYYAQHVLNDPSYPLRTDSDPVGPFGPRSSQRTSSEQP